MTTAALVDIDLIPVPRAVLRHRFVIEAQANARLAATREDARNRVIGTANTRRPELYGWGCNVAPHVDETGFMYLALLDSGRSTLFAGPPEQPSEWRRRDLTAGLVVRLNDHVTHWTEDEPGSRVAIFIGSWPEPADTEAVRLLRAGVDALARGDYYGAPRVREGFRVLMDDECLAEAADGQGCEEMLLADARAQGRWIQTCSTCGANAVRLDNHWPYHHENNRCRAHLLPSTTA